MAGEGLGSPSPPFLLLTWPPRSYCLREPDMTSFLKLNHCGAIMQLIALVLVFLIGLIAFAVDTSWIVVPAIALVYSSASDPSRQKSNRSGGSLSSLLHWPSWHRFFKPAPSLAPAR